MTRGFFVVLEGPEAAGKSTLARALSARFAERGIAVVMVREPGGTPLAEALRDQLLHAGDGMTREMELLYLVTARADLVRLVIRPALALGKTVISDRFDLSTLAYQGAGRELPGEMVRWVNDAATGGLRPDLTLVLDLGPELMRERQLQSGKGLDRMEREPDAFHARVAAAYRGAQGPGVQHLDGSASPGQVLEDAWAMVMAAHPTLAGRTATQAAQGDR